MNKKNQEFYSNAFKSLYLFICCLCSFLKHVEIGLSDCWTHCHYVCGTVSQQAELQERISQAGIASHQDFVWIQSLTELYHEKLEDLQPELPVELVYSQTIYFGKIHDEE